MLTEIRASDGWLGSGYRKGNASQESVRYFDHDGICVPNACFIVYPWGSLPTNATVVDVGGGNGHATLELLKAFPALKIIVQDTRASAIQGREVRFLPKNTHRYLWSRQYWEKEYPSALRKQQVDFVGFDFLTETPVTGGTVYYVSL